jgi:hypothetical protein
MDTEYRPIPQCHVHANLCDFIDVSLDDIQDGGALLLTKQGHLFLRESAGDGILSHTNSYICLLHAPPNALDEIRSHGQTISESQTVGGDILKAGGYLLHITVSGWICRQRQRVAYFNSSSRMEVMALNRNSACSHSTPFH